MRTFLRQFQVITLSLVFLALSATALRADDAAKPGVTQVAIVAAKSIDALTAFVKLGGMDLPPDMNASAIEQIFPFIGKGGLATDQPIGVAVCGGPDIKDPTQGIVFILPVKPTAATLDSLKAQGGTPVADHPDMMTLNGEGIRRTADYVIFSPTAAAVSAVDIGALADAVKSGDALIHAVADLKAARAAMPEQRKQLEDMLNGWAGNDKQAIAGYASILKTIDSVDKFEMRLDNGEKGVRLAFTATPSTLPAVTTANRPGMPAGVIGRIDLGTSISTLYPDVKDRLNENVKRIQDDPAGNKGKPFTDAQKQQVGDVINRIVALYVDSSAISVGVEMVGADPVGYVVLHRSNPMDVQAEIQKIAAEFTAIQKETDPATTLELQTYQDGGMRVLRLVFLDGTKPAGYADVAQKGDDVYVSICPNAYRYVHLVTSAKDEGPITAVFSLSLDLGKLLKVMTAPDGAMNNMQPEARKQLMDLLKEQKVRIASVPEGNAATLELTIDKSLVQNAPKIAAIFGLTPAPATAPATPDAKPN